MSTLDLFLAGVRTIREAIVDPAVVGAWDEPSVLEEQTVGSLAGHLARTGSFIMGEVLALEPPDRPVDFPDVAGFYVTLLPAADDPIHEGIRQRGAALASQGADALAAKIDGDMPAIEAELRARSGDSKLEVTGGNVMTIDQYLVTRILEQVVHLDDLARSVAHEAWPLPIESHRLVAQAAIDIAFLRHGPHAVVRGLTRRGHADLVLPAI